MNGDSGSKSISTMMKQQHVRNVSDHNIGAVIGTTETNVLADRTLKQDRPDPVRDVEMSG